MKYIIEALLTAVTLFVCFVSAYSQDLNFSGTWILNLEKSKLEDMSVGLTGSIFVIKQDGDKVKLTRYHIFSEKKKKISFTMYADSKVRSVKVLFRGKLEKFDSSLRATLWRKDFLNVVNYRFGSNQDEFVADEVFTGKPRDHHNIWVFDRERIE
jgi:hypothetical protein